MGWLVFLIMEAGRFTTEPDEWLVERFKATGNGEYFAELVGRHGKAVFARCYRVLEDPSDAEDVTQEAFMAAYTKIGLFRGATFAAWLHTIARNRCLNHLKSGASRRREVELDEAARMTAPPSFELDSERDRRFRSVLRELSAPQRVSLKLFYIEGYSYQEIARTTGSSPEAVRSHLQNGRRRFRLIWQSLYKTTG